MDDWPAQTEHLTEMDMGATKKAKTVLVLRTCAADMTSYGGFKWPKRGKVEAKDWRDNYRCGGGLHGLLWGEGSTGHLSGNADAKWLVVRVRESDIRHGRDDMTDKCKFRRGEVVHCGDRVSAVAYMQKHSPADKRCVWGTATAGDRGTATAGDRGTATAGVWGTATAGDRGTATAGYGGTATAGDGGTATAGDRGAIVIEYYDPAKERYIKVVGAVGDGIKANTKYQVRDGKLVEAHP
jgi:hypothetical protein